MVMNDSAITCLNDKLIRRKREKIAHRFEILNAATRVFCQKGYADATLDEIAREAEFSKGAIYLYFSSKEDIIYNIVKVAFNEFIHVVNKTLAGKKEFRTELRETLNLLAKKNIR